MHNYNWVCQACDQTNPPGLSACWHCECPADATGHKIEQYKKIAGNLPPPDKDRKTAAFEVASKVVVIEREPYFTCSTSKLVLMGICTFNLYPVYWFYKNWRVIKNYTPGSEIMPFWRGFFYGLWAYFCFREIQSAAHEIEKYKNLPIGYLAISMLAINACPHLPDPYDFLAGLVALPIVPVNNMAIAVNQMRDPNYQVNEEFSTWNKTAVWIGAVLWLFILLDTMIKIHHHS